MAGEAAEWQVMAKVAPTIGLRERKKAQTYDAIVGAALDLFERNGYDATTVEDIAEAADVSPRTFFRYFDAKVDVVMSHKENDDNLGLDGHLVERPAGEGPVEALRHVIHDELAPMMLDDPVMKRQIRIMLATPSLRAMARDHFNEHEAELARAIALRLGVPPTDLRAHVIAAAVGSTIWSVINLWVGTGREPEDLVTMIDEAFALLAGGLE
jgi:AcrR family transcriptional regulator